MMDVIIFLAAIVAGPALYRVRCTHRLWYGIGELGVGLLVLFLVSFPQGPTVAIVNQPPRLLAPLTKWAALAAGIYIIVRGLDNIRSDLPNRWRARWDSVFGSPHERG